MLNRQTNSPSPHQLNRRQRKAAIYGINNGIATQHRPLLIIAGAGTGKTETLGVRIGDLVAGGAKPGRMLVASFTRRASNELVERAQAKVAGGASVRLPYAGTFHSVAYKLLCEFGASVGLSEKFTVLHSDDAVSLMDRARAGVVQTDKRKIFPKKDVCCAIHSYSRNACLSLNATLRKRYSRSTAHAKTLAKIFASYANRRISGHQSAPVQNRQTPETERARIDRCRRRRPGHLFFSRSNCAQYSGVS